MPPVMSGVGDNDALRLQNVSLNRKLNETNELLTGAEKKCRLLTRERDAAKRKAKRKATNYESERKKQKASSESAKYWRKQVQLFCINNSMSYSLSIFNYDAFGEKHISV